MPNPAAKKKVLLVADENLYLIWSLPRLLHQAGAHLVLMAPEAQCFRHSRFVDEWLDAPSADAATVAARLTAHLAEHRYDLVVHATPTVADVLLQGAQPPPGMDWLRPDVARALATKTDFQPWAVSQHLPVPPGRVCITPQEVSDWVAQQGASVIKCDAIHGGFGVSLVSSPEEVRAVWLALNNPAAVVVQKFISGPVGCTELILQRGKVAGWFASSKGCSVTPFGSSIMRRLANPEGMAGLVEAVAAATGFHGLCGFDWIQDETTGQLVLLEFHPRASSGFGWGRYAGVDVPAALRDLLADRPAEQREPRSAAQLAHAPTCCYFPAHFWWALSRQRSALKYWLPGANAVSWRNVPFDDPQVLGGVLAFALRQLCRRHRPQRIPR